MGSLSVRVPSYRLHKPSGQAVVTLSGRDFYLGVHGTKTSKAAYDRLVGEWQTNGRRLAVAVEAGGPTMAEVILAYWRFCEGYYLKNGQPTSQLGLIKRALKEVRELYGKEPASEFGPLALKAVRQRFIDKGLSRSTCNGSIARVKRMIRWAAEQEMIPPTAYHGLLAVRGLIKGRTEAPDRPPVGPVPPEHVEAIVPLLRAPIATMVRLQTLTGMRPEEVCLMRGADLDRSAAVWTYIPPTHKTEHHDRRRVIHLGPRAQELLGAWLVDDPQAYLFRPQPLPDVSKANRTRKGEWKPGQRYSAASYGARVRDACRRAKVPVFSPNRLRHSAATRIRAEFGLEAAQVVLGHSKADVTQVYAERDLERARDVMRQVG